MASNAAPSGRQKEVDALVRAAAEGKQKPLYLFVGEPFQTAAAAKAIVDTLVPASGRDFNFETYDGRTTAIARVIDSLRMRGFVAGAKVVWLRETTLFLSGEKRVDVSKALFHECSEGREQDAAEKLLALVAMAGWSQDQFDAVNWGALSKTRLKEVFGDEIDTQQLVQLEELQKFCVARDLTVGAYRDDGAQLLEFLGAGLPPDSVLVLTASTVDTRKKVFKKVQEVGAVADLSVQRERSGTLSRESVDDALASVLREYGKRIAPAAHEILLRRAGTDAALLAMELQKLCVAVGDRATIGEEDVRANVIDMAESWIFDFTAALTSRQAGRAVPLLRGLFAQGEPPLRLLAMIVRELRLLLVARDCIDGPLRGKWRADIQYNAFQNRILPHIDEEANVAFGKAHPFVLYRRLQDASRIAAPAMRAAMVSLADLDARLKSTRTDPALLLEAFVIDWCRGRGVSRTARPARP